MQNNQFSRVLVASSCAAAIPSTQTEALAPATGTFSPTDAAALPGATVTQPVEVAAIATSRGPDLEATDPTAVNLASGQLQLIEFFRFT